MRSSTVNIQIQKEYSTQSARSGRWCLVLFYKRDVLPLRERAVMLNCQGFFAQI